VELPKRTPIRAIRRAYEEEDDVISLWLGDEGLVLETEVGLVPRLFEALEAARTKPAKSA
jgi:hypothetical protein